MHLVWQYGILMSINSYQVIVVFCLAVGDIGEYKLISGICCIWFDSRVY